MADNTYQPGVYRQQGGNRWVVASSGSLDVESGGEIDIESGGRLEINGTALITSGGAVDLSSARNWTSTGGIYTAGPVKGQGGMTSTGAGTFDSVTTTGGTVGSGKFNSMTSTGAVAGDSFTSTGGTAGSGKFNSVTSTGIVAGDSFTSTGGTVGSGKFNSVTSTGTITGNAFSSTGAGTFTGGVTSTGGIVSGRGYVDLAEIVTSTAAATLSNYGISVIGSISNVENVSHTISPVAGVFKTLIVVSSVTSASVAVVTAGTWDGTNNKLLIATTSGATNTIIQAVAASTSRWYLLHVNASSNYSLATT